MLSLNNVTTILKKYHYLKQCMKVSRRHTDFKKFVVGLLESDEEFNTEDIIRQQTDQ